MVLDVDETYDGVLRIAGVHAVIVVLLETRLVHFLVLSYRDRAVVYCCDCIKVLV